jgi:hypothetical protein
LGAAVVPDEPPAAVLAALGADRREVTGPSDVPDGNANWLISGDSGQRLVLRRHHVEATPAGLAWEHAVLRHLAELARLGWPLSPLEKSAAGPVHRAVRVGLAAWPMEQAAAPGGSTWT